MNIVDVLDTFVMALNAFMIYTGDPVTSSIEAPGGAVARYRWGVDAAAVGMAVCRYKWKFGRVNIIVTAGAPLLLSCYDGAKFVANHAVPVVRGTDSGVVNTIIVPARAVAVVAGSCGYHLSKCMFRNGVAVSTVLYLWAM
jgi:hypothetical protein